jgi:hypothetical protein
MIYRSQIDIQSFVIGERNPRRRDTISLVVCQDFDTATTLDTVFGMSVVEWLMSRRATAAASGLGGDEVANVPDSRIRRSQV